MTTTHTDTAAKPAAKLAGAAKQQAQREARLARKLERAEDLDYLLLWLRTRDAQVLRSMLWTMDKACQRVRAICASLDLPLADGQAALAKAQAWLDQLDGLVTARGAQQALALEPMGTDGLPAEGPRTVQEKQALRAYRRAIAGQYGVDFYLPRSPEGRRFALALTALDGQLVRARAVDSLEDAGALLTQVGRLIREGHELVTELAQLTKIPYEPHPMLKRAGAAERARSTVEAIVREAFETPAVER
ncbi:hypothetical protein [Nitrospira calida]|jgi:hypothetical protein